MSKMEVKVFNSNDFDFDQTTKISSGAFGSIYKGKEKATGKIFAIKQVKRDQDEFIKEITFMKSFDYPTVLKVYGVIMEPLSLITEFYPNSLNHVIESRAITLNDTQKYIIILGIALGVRYLHSMKVAHCDLKPFNILLDSSLYPVIIDFYLSKSIESYDPEELFCGTPLYMSPELFQRSSSLTQSYDIRKADVYAFGVTMYNILFNKINFVDFHSIKNLTDYLESEQRPPLTEGIVLRSMENLMKRCWDQDPEKRPDFDEIVDILKSSHNTISDSDEIDQDQVRAFLDFCKEPF